MQGATASLPFNALCGGGGFACAGAHNRLQRHGRALAALGISQTIFATLLTHTLHTNTPVCNGGMAKQLQPRQSLRPYLQNHSLTHLDNTLACDGVPGFSLWLLPHIAPRQGAQSPM